MGMMPRLVLSQEANPEPSTDRPVNYEDFGAVGDGVTDDLPAIVKAHEFANEHGLAVETKPDAAYHLGRQDLTVIISTDTNWNTSRFLIDDTDVDNHRQILFEVKSLLDPVQLEITKLQRDQRQLDVYPGMDCWVRVESDEKKIFIRRGANQNNGENQNDSFILRKDGTIEGDIDWDYNSISKVMARPIDEKPLLLKGGVFGTIVNQTFKENDYWQRNIRITRSNTTVEGLTHRTKGEENSRCAYYGFITAYNCANITLRDCFVSGRKTLLITKPSGQKVSLGTYDLIAEAVVNYSLIGVRMENICDRTLWGVIGTNRCKNILLENCTLSRMDTHRGVSGVYIVRGCTLGYGGLNAVGRGKLIVENSILQGGAFISFRDDYGATWEGSVEIRNCRWIPQCGNSIKENKLFLFNAQNDGQWDFGYPCSMPKEILIDGLEIEDKNHENKSYEGPLLFRIPRKDLEKTSDLDPFPYALTEHVKVQNLKIASRQKLGISHNEVLNKSVNVTSSSRIKK